MVKKTSNKRYTPSQKEKYMCAKHKKFFSDQLVRWKKDIPTHEIRGRGVKTLAVLVTSGTALTFLFEKVRVNIWILI